MGAFITTSRLAILAAIAAITQLPACESRQPAAVEALNKPPGIANLLKERLRGDLVRGASSPEPFRFPARVRIVPYDYQTSLQQVDMLAQLDSLADALKKQPAIASDASVLPEAYGNSVGASFDGLMKLHTAVRADVFVLVSGRTTLVEAREKGTNPIDWFTGKAYWEAHTTLEALWVEAPSGHFLPSLLASAKAGPSLVSAGDLSTTSSGYALRTNAEGQAFKRLAEALVNQLKAEKAATPVASPSPSASVSPAPVASASPSASPSPSASASTSPAPDVEATDEADATDTN